MAPAGGLVLLAGGYFLQTLLSRPPSTATLRDAAPSAAPSASALPAEESPLSSAAGEVVVYNAEGAAGYRLPTAVVGGRWVALPVWAHVAGKSIALRVKAAEPIRLYRGVWTADDPVVLWEIQADREFDGLEFSPWEEAQPVQWRPLPPREGSIFVEILFTRKRGSWVSFPLGEEIDGAGILTQQDRVVGWTFGQGVETGYLWAGSPGSDLRGNIQVESVHSSLDFSCREAFFYRALNLDETTPAAQKFEALAEGFRRPSLLLDEDLPPRFRSRSNVGEMHSLASILIQGGEWKAVLSGLDDQVLREAADAELLKDAVLAVSKDQDLNRAIQFLDRVKVYLPATQGESLAGIDQFHAQLYKDWLREIIEKGGYFSGTAAYEEAKRAFPADPEIHLLGVEIALADKDLERARELLRLRDFPSPWRERADQLQARLDELEDREAVAIRFNPGEELIRVAATLNETRWQRFIVDTGANISAIPSSALEALGIRVDDATPSRWVVTAGGLQTAYEIRLDSLELQGFRVQNLPVLVIDLPGDADIGILGLDFLKNFRYEVDNKKGVLRLRKK